MATTAYDSLAEMRERGVYPGSRVGSCVAPNRYGTVCAVKAGSLMAWITWDGGTQELLPENTFAPLAIQDDEMSSDLDWAF